jgi:uncharacterized RDD family membrane protein YckC
MSDQQQSGPPAGSTPPAAGAPQAPQWGAPQPPQWGAPQPGWGQPQAPQWGAPQPPQPPGLGAPQPPGFGAPYGQPPVPGGMPPYGAPAYGMAGPGTPNYAGFWIRFVAVIIDGFILLALTIALAITIVGLLLIIPLWLCYMPVLWWKRGATFGQSALGLRVVRAIDGGPIDGGMAAIRGVVFWGENILGSSFLIGYVGFAWAAFEPRKRAWHDMAAGTVVIHTG